MKTVNMQRLSRGRGVLTQRSNQAGCWSSHGVMGLFYTTVTHQNSLFSRKIPALPYSKETWDEDGRFQRKNKTKKLTIFLPTGSPYAWWVVCLFFLWVSTSTACCRWECVSSEDFVCARVSLSLSGPGCVHSSPLQLSSQPGPKAHTAATWKLRHQDGGLEH